MKRILFVCLGNICRSPMAEFVMKELVKEKGMEDRFYIESAATSRYEVGNPVYPPAKQMLLSHGILCTGKTARQMKKSDYDAFDVLVGMDMQNIEDMKYICKGDPDGKIHMLGDYTGTGKAVADPYYTGDFQATWEDVLTGCQALFQKLQEYDQAVLS